MKKVPLLVVLFLFALLGVSNVLANCYTDKCKSSNNGRPIIINRMNGIDSQARSEIKTLQDENKKQDSRMDNIQDDIKTLDTNIKTVASDVKTLDGNVKKVDEKADVAGKKADDAQAKNAIQDSSIFNTWIMFAAAFIVLLAAVLYAIFGRRNHQQNQQQGQGNQNQNNGQQLQNGPVGVVPGQNPQVIGPFWGTAPQFHLQWGLPTVVGNNQNQQQPIPANPPVGNNP